MASANKLSINVSYNLYTNLRSIEGVKVNVIGILNYDQSTSIPYNINVLAINEKVVTLENVETYIKEQLFYHCIDVDNPSKHYLVWDDVIDNVTTVRLNTDYEYRVTFTVKDTFYSTMKDMVNDLYIYLNSKYGDSLDVSFVLTNTAGMDERDKLLADYKQTLAEAMTVASQLAKMKQIESLITKLATGEIDVKLDNLIDKIATIEETTNSISALIT
jgi:hypothetical protein